MGTMSTTTSILQHATSNTQPAAQSNIANDIAVARQQQVVPALSFFSSLSLYVYLSLVLSPSHLTSSSRPHLFLHHCHAHPHAHACTVRTNVVRTTHPVIPARPLLIPFSQHSTFPSTPHNHTISDLSH